MDSVNILSPFFFMPRSRPHVAKPSSVSRADASPAYHHGDLRRAIIRATVALLAEQKHWNFSLREVARRAGVSHNAPYNHFADKRALLAAVAAVGFTSLRELMQKKVSESSSPEQALVAIGVAYVRFGIAHPAQYRLMFGLALVGEKKDSSSEMEQAGLAAQAVLAGVIKRGADEGCFALSPTNQAKLNLAVLSAWSLVHGLTMLAIDGLAGEAGLKLSGTRGLAEPIARTLLDGLRRR